MKKIELRKANIEIPYRDRKEIKEGVTLLNDDQVSELIESFNENEEDRAKKRLNEHKTSISELSGAKGTYYLVDEYYLEENEYDEDGEWVSGGEISDYSKIYISLIETPSYKTLGTYDNMADAVDAMNQYDEDDSEVYLSF